MGIRRGSYSGHATLFPVKDFELSTPVNELCEVGNMSDRHLIDFRRGFGGYHILLLNVALAPCITGAFFQSMADDFGTGKGSTAVIFGLTTFSFFWLSLITSRLSDRYGPRPVLAAGAVALFVGLWATSNVNSIGIGYVTFGVGAGIAAACAYIPMVAHVGGWFEKSRATAVGISVAGIGVGTLIMNPLAARLIDIYSWRTTYRIFAVVGSLILIVGTFMMARAPGEAGAGPLRVRVAFRSPTFRRLWLAALCYATALFIPFVLAVPYAKERGISPVAAATPIGLLGGSLDASCPELVSVGSPTSSERFVYSGSAFVLCPIAFQSTWLFGWLLRSQRSQFS